eukprot:scaffold188430_cov18-Tisochrysis_lutea.AAC.2
MDAAASCIAHRRRCRLSLKPGVPRLLHQVCQLRLSVSALLLLPPCRPSGPAAHVSGAPGTHCQGCLQLGAPGRA